MELTPPPKNLSGSEYTEARGGCSMVIEDIVMGFTDISANSEGGFSSIFVGDKDCCYDEAFMADAQGLITSLVNTVLVLAKGFNKSADCILTETWAMGLAFGHCLLTPTDQAALRQAVITSNASLCPAYYRDAYLQAPLNCRGAIASMADISYPYFRVVFDACKIPY